jgi:hypothetical protein
MRVVLYAPTEGGIDLMRSGAVLAEALELVADSPDELLRHCSRLAAPNMDLRSCKSEDLDLTIAALHLADFGARVRGAQLQWARGIGRPTIAVTPEGAQSQKRPGGSMDLASAATGISPSTLLRRLRKRVAADSGASSK